MSVDNWSDDNAALRRELCERYGLQGDPFADAPERFFAGGQRQRYLESLRHFCGFGDMVLLLAGAKGVGRSRLLAQFSRLDKNQFDFRPLTVEQSSSTARLAATLWGFLRQPPPQSADPIAAIQAFFSAEHWQTASGRRWVLVFGDAGQVPFTVLEALVQGFVAGVRARAPVPLLLGTEALGDELQRVPAQPLQWFHQLIVRPLNEAESGEYIECCWQWVGGNPKGVLDVQRRQRLQRESDGYFARLKQVAPEILLSGRTEKPAPAPAVAGNRHVKLLGLVLALLLLGGSYAVVSWQYQAPAVALEADGAVTADAAPTEGATEVTRLREAMTAAEQRLRPAAAGPASQPYTPPLLPGAVGLSVGALLAIELSDNIVEPELQPAPVEAVTEGAVAERALTDDAAEPGLADSPFVPAATEPFRGRSWVEGIQADKLTVQILGSFEEQTAVRLIRQHQDVDLFYVRSTYRQRPWFVVLYGLYDDRAQAQAGVAQLPSALRSGKPWIRATQGL